MLVVVGECGLSFPLPHVEVILVDRVRRKMRCDGTQPSCGASQSCHLINHHSKWPSLPDTCP
jgi:hypothetical protein